METCVPTQTCEAREGLDPALPPVSAAVLGMRDFLRSLHPSFCIAAGACDGWPPLIPDLRLCIRRKPLCEPACPCSPACSLSSSLLSAVGDDCLGGAAVCFGLQLDASRGDSLRSELVHIGDVLAEIAKAPCLAGPRIWDVQAVAKLAVLRRLSGRDGCPRVVSSAARVGTEVDACRLRFMRVSAVRAVVSDSNQQASLFHVQLVQEQFWNLRCAWPFCTGG